MKDQVIFPQTVWMNTGMGFTGISNLQKTLKTKLDKLKMKREYQAIVFEIENLDDEILNLIVEALPDKCDIPAFISNRCVILNKNGVTPCSPENPVFQELMRQAHLTIVTNPQEEGHAKRTVTEIDRMCDVFADIEGIPIPLAEFNIEHLLETILIEKEFSYLLSGILVDIKTIWFALEYDSLQLARNISPKSSLSGKIYGASELRGTDEEQEINRRFKRYIYVSSSIVRIRALWEKLIGLAILLERPASFYETLKAKRVRSTFIKNFKDSRHPVTRKIWDHVHSVDVFEERFRTPELHKIGRAIWWSTEEHLGDEINRLLAHRNDINRLLRSILAILSAQGKVLTQDQ